jgi:hypothetical protein
VHAALPGDKDVERGKRAPFAGQDQDVGRGALACPVAGGQPDTLAEAGRLAAAAAGKPVIEQAERDADAGSDGGSGVAG